MKKRLIDGTHAVMIEACSAPWLHSSGTLISVVVSRDRRCQYFSYAMSAPIVHAGVLIEWVSTNTREHSQSVLAHMRRSPNNATIEALLLSVICTPRIV